MVLQGGVAHPTGCWLLVDDLGAFLPDGIIYSELSPTMVGRQPHF